MGGDSACPGFKSARRLEAGVGPVDAPESLYRQVLGRGRVAHDAQQPFVHGALMKAEERLKRVFESFGASLPELVQDVALFVRHPSFPLLSTFTCTAPERLHASGRSVDAAADAIPSQSPCTRICLKSIKRFSPAGKPVNLRLDAGRAAH